MSDGVPVGARCGSHPQVAAVDVCQRCGRFLCGECLELFEEESYCQDCAAKLAQPPSGLARAALWLTGLSWLVFGISVMGVRLPVFAVLLLSAPLPGALGAMVLAAVELRRIGRGDASPKGKRLVWLSLLAATPLFLLMVGLFGWGTWKVMRQ